MNAPAATSCRVSKDLRDLRVRSQQFSLLELILVMVLLVSLLALTVPRLAGFFSGSTLDAEARRIWALSRYAQQTAITRAIPVQLWHDAEAGTYGVEAVPGFGQELASRVYTLPADLSLNALTEQAGLSNEMTLIWWPDGSLDTGDSEGWGIQHQRSGQDWQLVLDPSSSSLVLTKGDS